jgi:hypothetical protein
MTQGDLISSFPGPRVPLFSTVETNVKVLTQRDMYLTQSPASDQQILFH